MTRTLAFVELHPGATGNEPPSVAVLVDPSGEDAEFGSDLDAAIAWARERSDRVLVRIDAEQWSAGTTGVTDVETMTDRHLTVARATVAREYARHAAESATTDEPRPWYLAILNPSVDGPLDTAEALVRNLDTVRSLDTRRTRRGEPVWVVEVHASCEQDVSDIDGTITMLLWPEDRISRTFTAGAACFSSGDQQRSGLIEYVDRCDLLSSYVLAPESD